MAWIIIIVVVVAIIHCTNDNMVNAFQLLLLVSTVNLIFLITTTNDMFDAVDRLTRII